MIIKELNDISRTMQMVSIDDAKDLLRVVNDVVAKLTHAHIIDVLWKDEAERGIILRPFSGYDTSRRGGARPYQITQGASDEPTCVWTWVYENKKPLWIQPVRSQDLTQPIKNEATRDMIEPRYLNFWETTDSIMAIPLEYRGKMCGVYSIELPNSDFLSIKILEFLEQITKPIARIISKADWWKYNHSQTGSAISQFIASIGDTIDDSLLKDLYKISVQTDFMTIKDAEQIATTINNKIISMLDAHIVDILWREEGWDRGDILNPFSSSDLTSRGGAKSYQIKGGTNPTGVWTLVFEQRESLWLENMKNHESDTPLLNRISESEIAKHYQNFWEDTDSMLAIPLIYRGNVNGVYSVELPESGKITDEIISLLQRLAEYLLHIISKADYYQFTRNQRKEIIREHCDKWKNYKVEQLLPQYRTGFIVRPFEPVFNGVEQSLNQFFNDKGINAQRYVYEPGKCFNVIENIMEQISRSHFGIIDITGCKLNVMVELGMLLISNKRFILIRDKQDTSEIPFDISSFQCYSYDLQSGNQLYLMDPGSKRYQPVDKVLEEFIKNLRNDINFQIAKEWHGR